MYVYVNGLTNKGHEQTNLDESVGWICKDEIDAKSSEFPQMEREIYDHSHTKEIDEELAIAKSTGGASGEVDAKGEILGSGDSEDVVVVSYIYSRIT